MQIHIFYRETSDVSHQNHLILLFPYKLDMKFSPDHHIHSWWILSRKKLAHKLSSMNASSLPVNIRIPSFKHASLLTDDEIETFLRENFSLGFSNLADLKKNTFVPRLSLFFQTRFTRFLPDLITFQLNEDYSFFSTSINMLVASNFNCSNDTVFDGKENPQSISVFLFRTSECLRCKGRQLLGFL